MHILWYQRLTASHRRTSNNGRSEPTFRLGKKCIDESNSKAWHAITATSPPVVSRGAFYYGSDSDPNIYLSGGTTAKANTSFPGFVGPLPITFTMWSFNTHSHEWDHYDLSDSVRSRPSSGAYAEARDQHRSFLVERTSGLGELDVDNES